MVGWIGVDLDGTLAEYGEWQGEDHIGEPIEPMVKRVRDWLDEGIEVKIFTARVAEDEEGTVRELVEKWSEKHLGQKLQVTNKKDHEMLELWDDRAVQVIPNTGKRADGKD